MAEKGILLQPLQDGGHSAAEVKGVKFLLQAVVQLLQLRGDKLEHAIAHLGHKGRVEREDVIKQAYSIWSPHSPCLP